jgi:hypothetical protein
LVNITTAAHPHSQVPNEWNTKVDHASHKVFFIFLTL